MDDNASLLLRDGQQILRRYQLTQCTQNQWR